jgi:hypothetical protein
MSEVILKFQEQELMCFGGLEKPEFRAGDVVNILYPESEPRNRHNYLQKVPSKWKGRRKITTLGGPQDCVTLLEPGLYLMAARSNSPLAIPFQEWLFEEVLPAIRKTGSYGVNDKLIADNRRLLENRKRLLSGVPEGSLTLGTVARMYGLKLDELLLVLTEAGALDLIRSFCKIAQYQRIAKDSLPRIADLVDEHRQLNADAWQLDLL